MSNQTALEKIIGGSAKSESRLREEERYLAYRIKVLPIQLDKARRKYRALVREARRLKMTNLLNNEEMFGKEFD